MLAGIWIIITVHFVAGYLSDLHIYNVTSMIWNDISSAVAGDSPSPRNGHRITPMEGKLYVQGGDDTTGERGET